MIFSTSCEISRATSAACLPPKLVCTQIKSSVDLPRANSSNKTDQLQIGQLNSAVFFCCLILALHTYLNHECCNRHKQVCKRMTQTRVSRWPENDLTSFCLSLNALTHLVLKIISPCKYNLRGQQVCIIYKPGQANECLLYQALNMDDQVCANSDTRHHQYNNAS